MDGEGLFGADKRKFILLISYIRVNVNYNKSVQHPIPTQSVGIRNTLAILKINSMLSFQSSVQVYCLLGQSEEKKGLFCRVQEGWAAL